MPEPSFHQSTKMLVGYALSQLQNGNVVSEDENLDRLMRQGPNNYYALMGLAGDLTCQEHLLKTGESESDTAISYFIGLRYSFTRKLRNVEPQVAAVRNRVADIDAIVWPVVKRIKETMPNPSKQQLVLLSL